MVAGDPPLSGRTCPRICSVSGDIGRLFVAGVILNPTLWVRQNPRDNEATGGQSPNRGDAT